MSQPFAILLAEQAVREFTKQWYAGLQPCLLLETHSDGAIFVSSRVTVGVTLPQRAENVFPPTHASQDHYHQRRRPPGPSRLRRRARRAQARDQAAAEAAANPNKSSEAAVEASASPTIRSDAAVQAAPSSNFSSATAEVAVQADIVPPHLPAAQADPQPGQAEDQLQALLSQLHGGQHVMDAFCVDKEYFEIERKRKEDERKKERQEELDKIKRMMENF